MHGAAADITVPPRVSVQTVETASTATVNDQVGDALLEGDTGAVITGATGAVVSYV